MDALRGFSKDEAYSPRLNNIIDTIFELYENVSSRGWFGRTTYEHTSRVVSNVMDVYARRGETVNEEVYAAALCHDTGKFFEECRSSKEDNHGLVSAMKCERYLREAGYDDQAIDSIKRIIISHNDDVYRPDIPFDERVIKYADKLDRLGKTGLNRLYENRKNSKMSQEEIMHDIERIMTNAYRNCTILDVDSDLVKELYEEGIAALEEMKEKKSEESKDQE